MKRNLLLMLMGLIFSANSYADNRTIVWLSAEQKAMFLQEMRDFMSASQQILEASLADNMDQVEKSAREVGIKMIKNTPLSLKKQLPPGMMKLGPETHRGFESIADEASSLGDKEVILNRLAALQKNCVACHKAYQIKVKALKL
ncbi:hypothetical protein [Hydrogenovibrio kuenenii]|uniref:hypothetical protein n=1 Tax=Hydrogenovibrio kuenenii TaxID=63658 RepID=UPI000465AB85|nr:hypothetical protein [Hydrogenovibrio kuenenii]